MVEELRESRRIVRSDIYYHVTTEENAQKIISSKQLKHSNWESKVYAWRKQPTIRQTNVAGIGSETKTALRFRTNAHFQPDRGNQDISSIKNIVVETIDMQRLPISIKEVTFIIP